MRDKGAKRRTDGALGSGRQATPFLTISQSRPIARGSSSTT